MSDAVRCMWMRGGTSKGGYFLADELPVNRDEYLLRIMGSPDNRQIDGMGGADPLASKVASLPHGDTKTMSIEHPSGSTGIEATLDGDGSIKSAAILRTARKLFDGIVYS